MHNRSVYCTEGFGANFPMMNHGVLENLLKTNKWKKIKIQDRQDKHEYTAYENPSNSNECIVIVKTDFAPNSIARLYVKSQNNEWEFVSPYSGNAVINMVLLS